MEGKNKPWISIADPDPGGSRGVWRAEGTPEACLGGDRAEQLVHARRTETASRSEATLLSRHLLRLLS